ncbi:Gp49 family protein [Salmonella enterica]|uniref:Gp49 family protein n=1 Tax=Salmonella enterica TaxID=28901 RepID=UPI00223862A5|nr:Gp49 family protein [Salmonella enterica]MCW6831681.1 Gp49 family protein [Salmonella enterica]
MATVSKESIEAKIKSVIYLNVGAGVEATDGGTTHQEILNNLNLVTLCIIILENGFKVEGVSACVDPANYDESKGRECAYENAFNKIWELEGYMLRQALYEQAQSQEMLKGFLENNECEGGGCKI